MVKMQHAGEPRVMLQQQVPLDVDGRTSAGHPRKVNEDQFAIVDLGSALRVRQSSLNGDVPRGTQVDRRGALLVVADGLGGHGHGDRASSLAVKSVLSFVHDSVPWLLSLSAQGPAGAVSVLAAAMRCADAVVTSARTESDSEATGTMGTTLTLASVVWPQLSLAHAGDSRCYLLREGLLTRLTSDHTVGEDLARRGRLPDGVAPDESSFLSTLTTAVGGDSDLDEERRAVRLCLGDQILVCTDGLTHYLSDADIGGVMQQAASARAACDELIDRALQRGGSDNVTAVVARVPQAADA
jgi:protein phosphatase